MPKKETMDISYTDIMETCKDLALYEAGRLRDGGGASMYDEVQISEQDEPQMELYIGAGAAELVRQLVYLTEESSIGNGRVQIDFIEESSRTLPTVDTMVHAIASLAMQRWLQDKDTARSEAYGLIAANMVAAVKRSITRKRPKLSKLM